MHKETPQCQPPPQNSSNEDEPSKLVCECVLPYLSLVPLVPLDLGDDCTDYVPTRLLEKLGTQFSVLHHYIESKCLFQ